METVTSADGTTIAYETVGSGPPVVLVDGALCHRSFGPAAPLAQVISERFTVFLYDRRGRGASGDGGGIASYHVDREVEDLAAVVAATGGEPYVYGISSGAALVLRAADHGVPMAKAAVYEAPFLVDSSAPEDPPDYRTNLHRAVTEDRRGDAVAMFLRLVGTPSIAVRMMKVMPVWRKLKSVAHTLPYDEAILDGARDRSPLPSDRYANVAVPVLSMAGGKSPEWMRQAMRQVADVLPDAEYRTIDGQTHMLKPDAIAPHLYRFFT